MLAASIAIGMFAGCGEQNTENSQPESSATNSETTSSGDTASDLEELELVVWKANFDNFAHEKEIVEDVVGDYIYNKFKIKVQAVANQGVDTNQRLQMYIAGGDIPDLIVNYGWADRYFTTLYENNLAWKITPEIMGKYMPATYSMYSDFIKENYVQTETPFEGAYNSIFLEPTYDVYAEKYPEQWEILTGTIKPFLFGQSRRNISIREDVLKAVRPEAKTTDELTEILEETGHLTEEDLSAGGCYIDDLDQFAQLLRDIKAAYPDMIPALFHNPKEVYWTLLRMAGAEMNFNAFDWKDKEFVIQFYDDASIEAYRKVNKMFQEGLLPVDMFIQKEDTLIESILSGNVGLTATYPYIPTLNEAAASQGQNYKWRNIYVGMQPTDSYRGTPENILPGFLHMQVTNQGAIKDDATLARVLEWVDFFATEEYAEISMWGPESAGLYEVVDGKKQFKTEVLQNHALKGIESPGEKDGWYYGLDWANQIGGMSDRIEYWCSYKNPFNPKFLYPDVAPSSENLWDYAVTLTKNPDNYDGLFRSYESYVLAQDPEINALVDSDEGKKVTEVTQKIENEYWAKLLTAKDDAEFDSILAEIQGMLDDSNITEFKEKVADELLAWYDENPEYARPDTLPEWK